MGEPRGRPPEQPASGLRARLRRLARLVGGPAADMESEAAPREVRAALGAVPQVARLTAWLAGERDDPWLDLAQELGLEPAGWLGVHENFARTVGEALGRLGASAHDLDAVRQVLGALPRATVVAAARRWQSSPRADCIRHLGRLFADGTDLGPARRAWISARRLQDVGSDPTGFVEAWQRGDRDGFVDWDAERHRTDVDVRLQSSSFRRAVVRLRCGVHLRVELLDGRFDEPVFSALELTERDVTLKLEHTAALEPSRPHLAPRPRALPDRLALSWFPSLDHVLRLLGDAILGGDGWLPAAERPHSVAVERSGPQLALWSALYEAVPLLGDHVPLDELAAVVGVPPDDGVASERWLTRAADLLAARAVARWQDGLAALHGALGARRGARRRFHALLEGWLCDPLGFSDRRRIRAEREHFGLDPVGDAADARLLHHVYLGVGNPRGLTTWVLNEWPEVRDVLGLLAREGQRAARGGRLTAFHRELMAPEVTPASFRVAVSKAARTAWCCGEIDAALEAMRPAGLPGPAWRARHAPRIGALPREPWTRSWLVDGADPLSDLKQRLSP